MVPFKFYSNALHRFDNFEFFISKAFIDEQGTLENFKRIKKSFVLC